MPLVASVGVGIFTECNVLFADVVVAQLLDFLVVLGLELVLVLQERKIRL